MNRKIFTAIAATLVIVLLAAIIDRLFLSSGDSKQAEQAVRKPDAAPVAPVTTPDAAAEKARPQVVAEIEGTVERLDADGTWKPIVAGTTLSADDRVRTKSGARAIIQVDKSRVVLDENTNVSVSGIRAAVSEVRLKVGRVSADVSAGAGRPLNIRREGADLVARTAKGRFSMMATKRGDTFVASSAGKVDVTANNKTVTVAKGEQTSVLKGKAPTAPQKIPASLFLKLHKSYAKSRSKRYLVRGKADPFARITVNGIPVQVSSTGEFSQIVSLREGFNKVKVKSKTVSGRTKDGTVNVAVDTSGPDVKGTVEWGK